MFLPLLRPYIKSSHKLSIKRGDFIYHEGESPESLFLIESGLVGLFHNSETGKETFLRVFGKDDIFGHRSYFAQTNYHASTVALEKTELIVISKDQCNEICQSDTELLKTMLMTLSKDLGEAELRLAGLQDKTAPQRIAESLIYFKLKYPDHTWTRKEIAEFSGSTFESVTRVMTKLSDRGLIAKEGRDYSINDHQKLLEFDHHQG